MHRGRITSIVLLAGISALIALLAGCGGGDPGPRFPGGGGGGGQPGPPPGTANIEGVVVDGQNVANVLQGALVAIPDTAHSALTDGQGAFQFAGVTPGTVTLDISFPSTGLFQGMRITVQAVADQVTTVTIAALRGAMAAPNSVTLRPTDVTVDVGGEVRFTADVRAFGVPVDVTPSFALVGDIGALLPSGVLTATQVGTGTVTALVPGATAQASIEVVGPRPPALGILSVSPSSLPAVGGNVRISISATDGDGIASVAAEVEKPDQTLDTVTLDLVAGSGSAKDGSWAGDYLAPANTNAPDASGKQLPQRYSVRVVVEDNSGATTTSQWTDFTVIGLDAPPPPP